MVEEMLSSSDEEMVNLAMTILTEGKLITQSSYDEIILKTIHIVHFNIHIIYNIFENKFEWQLHRKHVKQESLFIKDPTKCLKLVQKK